MNSQPTKIPSTSQYDFASIFSEYQPKILRFVTAMVGQFEAEDLTQEIFTRVTQALPDFRAESKVSTWLYRIATNAALDRLRSPAFKQSVKATESIGDAGEAEAEIDDRNIWTGEKIPIPEIQVVRKEMSACMQEYIQRLPERYRTVLVLSEFESLTTQEIADILGITIEAAKIRLHRARKRLKADLLASCPSYWVEGNEFLPDLKDL